MKPYSIPKRVVTNGDFDLAIGHPHPNIRPNVALSHRLVRRSNTVNPMLVVSAIQN